MNKTITMDYEEYKNLLEQIERLKEFLTDIYNLTEDELDKGLKYAINEFMQEYGDWL